MACVRARDFTVEAITKRWITLLTGTRFPHSPQRQRKPSLDALPAAQRLASRADAASCVARRAEPTALRPGRCARPSDRASGSTRVARCACAAAGVNAGCRRDATCGPPAWPVRAGCSSQACTGTLNPRFGRFRMSSGTFRARCLRISSLPVDPCTQQRRIERQRELGEPVVEQRWPHFERDGHAAEVGLEQQVVGQVGVHVDPLHALERVEIGAPVLAKMPEVVVVALDQIVGQQRALLPWIERTQEGRELLDAAGGMAVGTASSRRERRQHARQRARQRTRAIGECLAVPLVTGEQFVARLRPTGRRSPRAGPRGRSGTSTMRHCHRTARRRSAAAPPAPRRPTRHWREVRCAQLPKNCAVRRASAASLRVLPARSSV